MRCMLPFCACGTKTVSCELQRAFGAIKCFLKHFKRVCVKEKFTRKEASKKETKLPRERTRQPETKLRRIVKEGTP